MASPSSILQVVLLRKYEDRKLEALSCSGEAVQKVRLDFGWEGALSGEGIEGVDMEWNALCYDITVRLHCDSVVAALQPGMQFFCPSYSPVSVMHYS